MKAEYILEPRQKTYVKEKQTLRSLLTEAQIAEVQNGTIVAVCGGQKLRLDDEVNGIVMMVSPLRGG